ncbi:MAG: PAC2 family protein [Candidatus Thorarchaeota archaeon]
MHDVYFMNLEEKTLKSPVAICGLPGIANVGRVTARTLIEVLDAKHVMDFYSTDFPPRVIVRKGIARIPKSTMHLYESAPDEPHDILIITGDFQPATGPGVYDYAEYVAGLLSTAGVRQLLSVAAYEQNYQDFFGHFPSPPRIYVSASSEQLLSMLMEIPDSTVTEEGFIVGANGVVPSWASTRYDIESATLLGETLGIIKSDYRAAKRVLESVAFLTGLKARFDIIDAEVDKVVEFIEWAMNEMTSKQSDTSTQENPSDSYIG